MVYSANLSLPGPTLTLAGRASALNRALQYVVVGLSASSLGLEPCQVGLELRGTGALETAAVLVLPSAQPPSFTLGPSRQSLGAVPGGELLLPNLTLYFEPSAAEQPLQAVVQAGFGQVGFLGDTADVVPAFRQFELSIASDFSSASSVQGLAVQVPWSVEVQRVDFMFPGSGPGGSAAVAFAAYGQGGDDPLQLPVDGVEATAMGLYNLLASLPNVGEVTVTPASSSNSSHIALFVTFLSNAGSLPLLNVTSDGSFNASVSRQSAGSLAPQVLQVTLTANSSASGEFVLAVPRGVYSSAPLSEFIQTYPLALNASAADVSLALANLREQVGLVQVSAAANGTNSTFAWQLTFLTAVGREVNVQVLWDGGSSSPASCTAPPCPPITCAACESFSGNVYADVAVVSQGTVPLSGDLRLALDLPGQSFLTPFFPVSASGSIVADALATLPGVTSATVRLEGCSVQGACSWLMSVGYELGDLPSLRPVTTHLRGTDASVFVTKISAGRGGPTGQFRLTLPRSGGGIAQTDWLSAQVSASAMQSALQDLAPNLSISVSKDVSLSPAGCLLDVSATMTRTASGLNVSLCSSSTAVFGIELRMQSGGFAGGAVLSASGSLVSFADATLLPAIAVEEPGQPGLGNITISEIDPSSAGSQRFLLVIRAPVVPNTFEVQRITCSVLTSETVPTPALLSIAFRAFTSPSFDATASYDLAQLLETLPSIERVNVTSNSTTGAICPPHGPLTFVTDIAFLSLTGQSLGDLPLLMLRSISLPAWSTTSIGVSEAVKGSAPSVQEKQRIVISWSADVSATSLSDATIEVEYNGLIAVVPVLGTPAEWTSAVSLITQNQGILVSVVVNATSSVDIGITFPASFGRADLLSIVTSCPGETPSARPEAGIDIWVGSLCLQYPNQVTVERLVAGFTPLSGYIELESLNFSVTLPINTLSTSIQDSLRSQSGLVGATVTNVGGNNFSAYVIDFHSSLFPLSLNPSMLSFNGPQCAEDVSQPAPQLQPCVFPFEYKGQLYSACTDAFSRYSACSLTQNLTHDLRWGICVACDSASVLLPSFASLSPLYSSVQLSGTAASIAKAVSELAFFPISSQLTMGTVNDAITVVVYDPSRNATLVSESSVAYEYSSNLIFLAHPSQLIAVEDSPLLIDSFSLECSFCSSIIGAISVSVRYGSLVSLSHAGVNYSRSSTPNNLTMVGTLKSLQSAVSSLLYQPNANFYSHCSRPPVQHITLSYPVQQPYTLVIARNSTLNYSNISFTIALECIGLGNVSMLSSSSISALATDSEISTALQILLSACDSLSFPQMGQNGSSPTASMYVVNASSVSSSIGDLAVTSVKILLAAPLKNGLFPEFRVNSTAALTLSVERQDYLPPYAGFVVGYGGEWSEPLPFDVTSDGLQNAISLLPNVIAVSVTSLASTFNAGMSTVVFSISFTNTQPWYAASLESLVFSSQTQTLAFGEIRQLDIRLAEASSIASVTVQIVDEGNCSADPMSVVMYYPISSSNFSRYDYVIPIYVVPTYDMPIIDTSQVRYSALGSLSGQLVGCDLQLARDLAQLAPLAYLSVLEDSIICVVGVGLMAEELVDSSVVVEVLIFAPHATVNFTHISNVVTVIESHYTSLVGSPTAVAEALSVFSYRPDASFNGNTTLAFVVRFNGSSSAYYLPITVVAVPDEMSIVISASEIVLPRNEADTIPGLALMEAGMLGESSDVFVSVTCLHGSFLVPALQFINPNLYMPVSWQPVQYVTITGPVNQANTVLRHMLYYANFTGYGTDTIQIFAKSVAADESHASASIEVRIVDDGSSLSGVQIEFPREMVVIDEDSGWRFSGQVNLLAPANDTVTYIDIIVTCDSGTLSAVSKGSGGAIQLKGLYPAVSLSLQSVTYTPPPNFSGSVRIRISVVGNSLGTSPGMQKAEFYLFVQSVYDSPKLIIRPDSGLFPGVVLTSPISMNAFQVTAIEEEILITEMKTTCGAFKVIDSISIPSLGDGIVFGDFRVNGNGSDPTYLGFAVDSQLVNTVIQYIIFLPEPNRACYANISVSVRAIDPPFAMVETSLEVKLRPPPNISLVCRPAYTIYEDGTLPLADLCDVFAYVDPLDRYMQASLKLSSSVGTFVRADSTSGLWNFEWKQQQNNSVIITTRLLFLSEILQVVAFASEAFYNGNFSIYMTIESSSLSSAISLSSLITVLPVNNLPTMRVSGPMQRTLLSNQSLPLDFINITDVDLGEAYLGWLDLTIGTELGSIVLAATDLGQYEVLVRNASASLVHLMGTDMGLTRVLSLGLVDYLPVKLIGGHGDVITITACDNGFTGISMPSNNTNCTDVRINIDVSFVSTPPSFASTGVVYSSGDEVVSLGEALTLDHGSYPADTLVSFTVTTDFGYVSSALFPSTKIFTKEITLASVNQFLATLAYTPLKV